jgi:hypothetical protein
MKRSLQRWHLERFLLLRTLDATTPNALYADTHALDAAVHVNLNSLKIRPEGASSNPRDLSPDTAEVLRLTAARDLIPDVWFLPTNGTVHAHDNQLLQKRQYSGSRIADKTTVTAGQRRQKPRAL